MPLYEYECPACQQHFELMESIRDKPRKTCPNCKSRRLRRLVSAPAFQFKGSGWYVTDYAKNKGDAKKQEKSSESTESSEATKSSESKESAAAKSGGDKKGDSGKSESAPAKSEKKTSKKAPSSE